MNSDIWFKSTLDTKNRYQVYVLRSKSSMDADTKNEMAMRGTMPISFVFDMAIY